MKQNIQYMKGKNVFTQSEYDELERLVKLRVKASREDQKKIRNKMRRIIGFYGGDDFGIKDLTIDDLRSLRKSGLIVVIGDSQ